MKKSIVLFGLFSLAISNGFSTTSHAMWDEWCYEDTVPVMMGIVGIGVCTLLYNKLFGAQPANHFTDYYKNAVETLENPEFKKFVQKYTPPVKVQEYLAKNENNVLQALRKTTLLCKDEKIDRIINAERMKKIIQEQNLSHLDVAKKFIFKIEQDWTILAVRVKPSHNSLKITLVEVQQLEKLIGETCFCDWLGINVLRDEKGKLVFIDTEDASFFQYDSALNSVNSRSQCLIKMANFFTKTGFEEEAWEWLNTKIDELESNPSLDSCLILPKRTDLKLDFDAQEVARYHELLMKSK